MRSTFLLLSLLIGAQTFHILQMPESKSHQDITRMAILRATEKVCESVDTGFKTPRPLDSRTLAEACNRKYFTSNFETSIRTISYYNVMRDIANIPGNHPEEHFDNELFQKGRKSITTRMKAITKCIEKEKFDEAREELGKVFHTLQDFYSHSDWIEMGNTEPCTALINPEENIPNAANEDMETCDDFSNGLSANIKESIIKGKFLTSGYTRKSRPKGKCSHGGFADYPDVCNCWRKSGGAWKTTQLSTSSDLWGFIQKSQRINGNL
ncbi:von Willebrand factor A domain-containing protein 7 [Siphateles boraxobius]|uniref:von Willebrand factor A domain-containing protein 7 n=1 Tax=Siphateles boraxobius TaxID=180520 RepID=UPI0040640634